MSHPPIALQLYSIREDAEADLNGVLAKVKQMGYDGVEFAGLYDNAPADVKSMLTEHGLQVFGAHILLDDLQDDAFGKTVETYQAIGCDHLIVSWLPEERRSSREAWMRTGEAFTQVNDQLQRVAMRTGFHAHAMEFTLLPDGSRGWDLIAQSTPDSFIMQFDTANAMQGGGDPVQPIRDYPRRSELLHLKEYIKVADGQDPMKGHGQAAIGDGGVPWNDVFDAAESIGGTKVYIVEQEGHPRLEAMDAAELCINNLRGMLAAHG